MISLWNDSLWNVLLDASIKGFVIALVGIGLYLWQKRSERKTNKRDMARILHTEIYQILDMIPSRENERIQSDKTYTFPTNTVHSGLLLTGNIRFFSSELQAKLNKWYSDLSDLEIIGWDVDNLITIIEELEEMRHENRSYRDKIRDKIEDFISFIDDFI